MSWFGAFRGHYGFTWYGDNRTAVTIDFPLVTVTYLCVLIAVATLITTLGIRGRERWAISLRASYAVGISSIILVCLVGHDWLVGQTEVETPYLYRSDNTFRGTIGMRIALHGCNVTLEGYYKGVNGEGHVHYAESMKWTDYGKEQETIHHYLQIGLPHPVLTVLDFLSVDGGGLRWGRNYHSAGYFGCALLWTALAFWVISNVLLLSVVSYGAFMFFLTGVAMVLSCVVYHVCQPPHELRINFGESELTTRYGWCYWLSLSSGALTLILGAVLFVCDHMFHDKVSEFFNLDNLIEDEMMELPHADSAAMMSGKNSSLPLPLHSGGRTGGFLRGGVLDGRRPSLPQQPGQGLRKKSIFLEPQRRPSDYSMRSTSPFTHSGTNLGGITNKGFEQERASAKSNPLFSGPTATTDIQEENEDQHKSEDGKGEGGNAYNNKPSLATMREHRENHMNEQMQSSYSMGSGNDVTCTAVVIEGPSDEDPSEDDVRKMSSEVGEGMKEDLTSKGQDSCNGDSAFASAVPSPAASEKNSTCGDMEEIDP